jgi:hypothetical protein
MPKSKPLNPDQNMSDNFSCKKTQQQATVYTRFQRVALLDGTWLQGNGAQFKTGPPDIQN